MLGSSLRRRRSLRSSPLEQDVGTRPRRPTPRSLRFGKITRRGHALEEKYRESEALANAKLRAAWEERDIALAHASDLSADLERVRKQSADARRRLSASSAGSCDAERKQLARCADLVERGAELVRRGVELSERTAIDKDALTKIVSQ